MRAPKKVKYYVATRHQAIVCTTQRAASASMVESLASASPKNQNYQLSTQANALKLRKQGLKALLWIRNPLDRIACAYKVFGPQYNTVDDFIAGIISMTNPHWSPQTQLHTYRNEFLPTKVYAFEHLAETWAAELPGFPLQHIGANPERLTWSELESAMSAKTIDRVHEHWAEDINAHEWALVFANEDEAA